MTFSGFSIEVTGVSDYYPAMRVNHESMLLAKTLIERLGLRIRKFEQQSGWENRSYRDFFFFRYIVWTQLKDPSFIGIYHYHQSQATKGPRFQVWRYEHDSTPVIDYPLPELFVKIQNAVGSGMLPGFLDETAESIRLALKLR